MKGAPQGIKADSIFSTGSEARCRERSYAKGVRKVAWGVFVALLKIKGELLPPEGFRKDSLIFR